jgi:Leucine-rich repeat (LRR) protein
MLDKIKSLLHSGDSVNIDLALELIKAMGIDFDFKEYENAFKLLNFSEVLPDFDADALKWLLCGTYFNFEAWDEGLPIPDFIWELQHTEILHLENCRLEEIPASVSQLKSLDFLFLEGNQLSNLPPEIAAMQLVKLGLGSNRFEELPGFICEMTALWSLDADNNRLKKLPENIGNLTALQQFDLVLNRLETLPDSIGNLKELIVLDLADNCLTTLPENIKYCSKLKSVNLKNNQFSESEKQRTKLLLREDCLIKI